MEGLSPLKPVAKVLKAFGSDGTLVIRCYVEGLSEETEPVIVLIDNLPVPFYFTSFVHKGGPQKAMVRFENMETPDYARELIGKELFLPEDALPEEEGGEPGSLEEVLEGFVGLAFYDGTTGLRGTVQGYELYPNNPCLALAWDGGEALLPFHPDFIRGLDEEAGVLDLRTPQGLL